MDGSTLYLIKKLHQITALDVLTRANSCYILLRNYIKSQLLVLLACLVIVISY